MNKNYIEVPAKMELDINPTSTKWFDGKCILIDEGTHITIYIAHFVESQNELGDDVVKAYPIRIEKPLSRDESIAAGTAPAARCTRAAR